jgi:hypothetical protein
MARVEIIALLGSLSLLGLVVELVRRRRLGEAYSLLWLLTGVILLILSLWRELLDVLANLVGIFYPPAALFVVGFGFVLLILLQFSVVVSRLSDENRSLIQRLAILDWRLRQLEKELGEEPGRTAETQNPTSHK